jgi:hypothetical protein
MWYIYFIYFYVFAYLQFFHICGTVFIRYQYGSTVPYRTVLYTVQGYRVAYRSVPHYRYRTVWYGTVITGDRGDWVRLQYRTGRYRTLRYGMVRYNTVRYNSIIINN